MSEDKFVPLVYFFRDKNMDERNPPIQFRVVTCNKDDLVVMRYIFHELRLSIEEIEVVRCDHLLDMDLNSGSSGESKKKKKALEYLLNEISRFIKISKL